MNCSYDFTRFDPLREECISCIVRQDCRNGQVTLKNSNLMPLRSKLMDSNVGDIFTATLYIQQLMGAITKNALMIGKILKPIKEGKLYRGYGSHLETWGDYLREIKLSRSSADYLIRIYEVFGLLMEQDSLILGIDHSRLIQALPFVKTEEDAKKWIEEAKQQNPEGYRNCLQAAKGKPTSDTCECLEREPYEKCVNCGKWWKA